MMNSFTQQKGVTSKENQQVYPNFFIMSAPKTSIKKDVCSSKIIINPNVTSSAYTSNGNSVTHTHREAVNRTQMNNKKPSFFQENSNQFTIQGSNNMSNAARFKSTLMNNSGSGNVIKNYQEVKIQQKNGRGPVSTSIDHETFRENMHHHNRSTEQLHHVRKSPRVVPSPKNKKKSISPTNNIVNPQTKDTYFSKPITVQQQNLMIQPFHNKNYQSVQHPENKPNQTYKTCSSQKKLTDISQHKKSQSVYKKKIVDIIQGLQQSLGVIATKVKSSMNENGTSDQEKALLESALLAQKLALLTQNMNSTSTAKKGIENTARLQKSQKRANSKRKPQNSCRSTDLSSAVNPGFKHYYKTIEQQQQQQDDETNYKHFVEAAAVAPSQFNHHARARSDQAQQPPNRMKSITQIKGGSSSHQPVVQVQNVNTNYYFSIPPGTNHTVESFCTNEQQQQKIKQSLHSSRLASSLMLDQQPTMDIQEGKTNNGLKMVQQLMRQQINRPQSASIQRVNQRQTSTSATRGGPSIHKKLNLLPQTNFKPSMAQHKKSTSTEAALLNALFQAQKGAQQQNHIMSEQSKSSTGITVINEKKLQQQENEKGSPRMFFEFPPNNLKILAKSKTSQNGTVAMPTPNMLQKKNQVLSFKKSSITKSLESDHHVQRPTHKRMKSEGKINNLQQQSQTRDRSLDNQKQSISVVFHPLQSLIQQQNHTREETNAIILNFLQNVSTGPVKQNREASQSPRAQNKNNLKNVLRQALQINEEAYKQPSQVLLNQQLTARSDTYSSGYKGPSENNQIHSHSTTNHLMSNETTLKKKPVYTSANTNNQRQFPLQFTVVEQPPQFSRHFQDLTKNENPNSLSKQRIQYQTAQVVAPPTYIQNFNARSHRQVVYDEKVTSKGRHMRTGSLGEKQHDESPFLNLMPTPKAVQPLTLAAAVGGATTMSSNQSIYEQSNPSGGIPHRSSSIVVVPHSQAVSKAQHLSKPQENHRRQKSIIQDKKVVIVVEQQQSPRTKEKKRIQMMIKEAFSKQNTQMIQTTADFYRIGKMLGKGAFGRVNLAMHKVTEHLVAVKSMNKQFLAQEHDTTSSPEEILSGEKKKLLQELLILQKVATRHRHIVRLYDSFETVRHLVFVMELCAGGDLLTYVRKRGCLSEDLARELFTQSVAAVHYCHRKGIVHRDIKLDNLLLDIGNIMAPNIQHRRQVTVKLCDFGVSRLLSDPQNEVMTEQCGTPAYIAPEILLGCQAGGNGYRGFTPDLWSLGVCLYAMLYGTVPFKASNMSDLHAMIVKAKFTLKKRQRTEDLSKDLKSLIRGLLEPNPEKRLTMHQLRKHPWMLQAKRSATIEIFSSEEVQVISRDFTYQEMLHNNNNQSTTMTKKPQNLTSKREHTDLPLFTEHELDEECGTAPQDPLLNGGEVLLRNQSTKSMVLAPFNSTWSDKLVYEQLDPSMIVDKRVIKYANRVKDINRQYEMNNNCDLDNGVYNKFVNQSSSSSNEEEDSDSPAQENSKPSPKLHNKDISMFDSIPPGIVDQSSSYLDEDDNSLVTSMNGENNNFGGAPSIVYKRMPPQAPLVSQISENGEDELERIIRGNQDMGELEQLQTFLQRQTTNTFVIGGPEDDDFQIDYELIEQIEQQIGYPRHVLVDSVEQHQMNDAATCYHLLDKDRYNMMEEEVVRPGEMILGELELLM